jgi:hypothetical protein
MTYEERQKAVCQQCHSQRAIECGFVSRGLSSKCSYLQDVMYGWELGQKDTIEAINAMVDRMMSEEMSFYETACKDGDEEVSSSPMVYTRLQMLRAEIDKLIKTE